MLVILEGPDGAGKSTLAEELQRRLPGAEYVHHGPYLGASPRELSAVFMASMKPAFTADLIMDRCWLSEPIYASVFRKSESRISSVHKRMLERTALALNAVVVLCRPPFSVCERAFLSGRDEYMQTSEQLLGVHDQYVSLKTDLPVIHYDYTQDSIEDVLVAIGLAKQVLSKRVLVTLLSDRPTSRTAEHAIMQIPFVAFSKDSCSEWLAKQLEVAGIPETNLSWKNTHTYTGEAEDSRHLGIRGLALALGVNAAKWCVKNNIYHEALPHPQTHMKYHFGKPYQLIEELKLELL